MTTRVPPARFAGQVTPLIITFNEEDNLPRTLAALEWAETIVVIDSGSTDGTLDILAKNPRVRVVQRPFDTFADQCNFGIDQVTTPWVLSLDADYVLTEELQREICTLNPSEARSGYRTDFIYCVFGKPLRSTLYPARTILYRRNRARYHNDGHGHRVTIVGEVGRLKGRIEHDDRKPLDRWFRSQIGYARVEAAHLNSADPATLKLIDRLRKWGWPAPFIMLAYTLLWRGYVLDGRAGHYYVFQRVLAELMLAIEINDIRVRPSTDDTRAGTPASCSIEGPQS